MFFAGLIDFYETPLGDLLLRITLVLNMQSLIFVGGGVLATSIVDGLREYEKTASSDGIRYNISITARRETHARVLEQRYPDLLITINNRDPR